MAHARRDRGERKPRDRRGVKSRRRCSKRTDEAYSTSQQTRVGTRGARGGHRRARFRRSRLRRCRLTDCHLPRVQVDNDLQLPEGPRLPRAHVVLDRRGHLRDQRVGNLESLTAHAGAAGSLWSSSRPRTTRGSARRSRRTNGCAIRILAADLTCAAGLAVACPIGALAATVAISAAVVIASVHPNRENVKRSSLM